ncbi:MAG TPA: DUF4169 family protein [Stellaceae bacterium]|nr:DUF4169 family protein [Stellaceae bacterium]
MAELINLNRYRKERARAQARKRADENRHRFGRSRNERNLAEHESERSSKDLDGKHLD